MRRKSILLLLFVCLARLSSAAVVFAIGTVVTATVKPWYSLKQAGITLFSNTNMTIYMNGKPASP